MKVFPKMTWYAMPMEIIISVPWGRNGTYRYQTMKKTESGYITESAHYQAKNCSGCPLHGQCFKAWENRVVEVVNHRLKVYKKKAADLLTSEEGIIHRGRRCIEKDKITMDFSFFATAFNIKKLCKMLRN